MLWTSLHRETLAHCATTRSRTHGAALLCGTSENSEKFTKPGDYFRKLRAFMFLTSLSVRVRISHPNFGTGSRSWRNLLATAESASLLRRRALRGGRAWC